MKVSPTVPQILIVALVLGATLLAHAFVPTAVQVVAQVTGIIIAWLVGSPIKAAESEALPGAVLKLVKPSLVDQGEAAPEGTK